MNNIEKKTYVLSENCDFLVNHHRLYWQFVSHPNKIKLLKMVHKHVTEF